MNIYFHIINKEGVIIASNIPEEFTLNRENVIEKIKMESAFNGIQYRHGLFSNEFGSVYLATAEKNLTNKIFKRYFDSCFFFLPQLVEKEKEFREKELQNFRRLKHNLITHNTNILQELEKNFPQKKISKAAKNQIEYIENIIEKNKKAIAIATLKILKRANLMKSEFDVYDMLVSKNKPYLEFDEHNIHKIILQILSPFWLEFVEKGIQVEINDCHELVRVDYRSISVAFTHLFENAVKYTAPNTGLKIGFESEKDKISICFEMTSLKITQNDLDKIYDEAYSGEHAEKWNKHGSGLGMNIVKELLTYNNGEISIQINVNPSENLNILNSIPFERNRFYVKLPKKGCTSIPKNLTN